MHMDSVFDELEFFKKMTISSKTQKEKHQNKNQERSCKEAMV